MIVLHTSLILLHGAVLQLNAGDQCTLVNLFCCLLQDATCLFVCVQACACTSCTSCVLTRASCVRHNDAHDTHKRYWRGDEGSTTSSAAFDVGLLDDTDWRGAVWLGGGEQRQFKLHASSIVMPAAGASAKIKLYVASPGGATVKVGDKDIGDPVGVSLWADNRLSVHYFAYDLSALLFPEAFGQPHSAAAPTNDIIVTCGGGFWASNTSQETWGHGQDRDMQPGHPACKLLLVEDSGQWPPRVVLRSGADGISGRWGPVLSDDPWRGSTIDTTLSDGTAWTNATVAPATPASTPSGVLFPLPAPYARTVGSALAVSVTAVPQRPGTWLYTFPANIVGHASVKAGAASGRGNLTLE